MKKKEYIDAIDEIKADRKLKTETLNKITLKKKSRKISILATAIMAFALAISIVIPMNNNKNKTTPIQIVQENNGLPKVENFENFYNIIKNAKSNNMIYGEMLTDSAINSSDVSTSEKVEL